jgi:N-methylhydantoinase A
MRHLRFGVDVGGTFTDVFAYDEASGELSSLKVPTETENQARSVSAGLRGLLQPGDATSGVVHGTTVVTNAILEGRGAAVTLVTTEGFRDVLEIARLSRDALYELQRPGRPAPLVPRSRRLEVAERMRHDGSVAHPLTESEVDRVVAAVRQLGADALAICLLHSYANPTHEQMLKAALAGAPHVCLSSEINAEFREFERTSTTVLNASVMPIAAGYVEQLERALAGCTAGAPLHLVQSSGGMMASSTAAAQPLRMVMSGPAAGVAAAQSLLRGLGIADGVTFDMGGTSTDVCLIADGIVQTARERTLEGRKMRIPSVGVESIGAGGGSVAWLDPVGALKVGPRSAGARPGPAAYGLGGREPTVTDANVVLGLIRPGQAFGQGAIRVDSDLAHAALARIAEPLGLSVPQTALGVVEVANANMLRAIRLVSVQRGVDPRDLTLVAYGGAGPLHATRLAQTLGIPRVVVPAYSSTFSALGCLTSELRYDVVQTFHRPLQAVGVDELAARFESLEAVARAPLEREGHGGAEVIARRSMDLRYAGQNYELEVPLAEGAEGLAYAAIRDCFYEHHRALYTYATDEPVECVALRLTALVPGSLLRLPERKPSGPTRLADDHACFLPGFGEVRAAVYDRSGLGADQLVDGPALIEDEQSTTVVPPGQRARADAFGNLHITSSGSEA